MDLAVPLPSLHQHYSELLHPSDRPTHPESTADSILPSGSQFFTVDDLYCAISSLKRNKALGNCNISAEVLQSLIKCEGFARLLCSLFNTWVEQGLPSSWNQLLLTSLYKKGSRVDPANYRGIAVMNIFAKLYSTCLTSRLDCIATDRALRAPA
jgi:hypothetical protein